MKKTKDFKVAAGTTVHSDTGRFTVTGHMSGSERFYVCDFYSDVNPAYNMKNMQVREQDIDYLFTIKK